MSGQDILIASADAAARTVGTDFFLKITKKTLGFTAQEMLPLINSTDYSGLYAPMDIEQEGKDRQGAILVMEDRVILAWIVGTLRIKGYHVVVPREDITGVRTDTVSGGRMMKDREILYIDVEEGTWEVKFASGLFEGGNSLVPFLMGILDGSLKFAYDESELSPDVDPG